MMMKLASIAYQVCLAGALFAAARDPAKEAAAHQAGSSWSLRR
jgi:hypothetical protein